VAEDADDDALTPLERGALRREVLDEARAALSAWIDGDTEALKKHFADDLVEDFVAAQTSLDAEGKKRVRDHEQVFLDMTDLNQTGTQAIVEYRFNDGSYVADASGKRLTDPTGDEETVQLTWEKSGEGWRIIRVIGAPNIFS
jgi:hypothetical protein